MDAHHRHSVCHAEFHAVPDVIWGINFKRFIRRKNEEDLWSGWKRMFGSARISQAGNCMEYQTLAADACLSSSLTG